jgi:hypothetical protein
VSIFIGRIKMDRETKNIEEALANISGPKGSFGELGESLKITEVRVERAKGDKWSCVDNGDGTWTCEKQAN